MLREGLRDSVTVVPAGVSQSVGASLCSVSCHGLSQSYSVLKSYSFIY